MSYTNYLYKDFSCAIFNCGKNVALTKEAQCFRNLLFVDKLRWDLNVQNNLEFDEFDLTNCIYNVVFYQEKVVGYWRAIRADNPYLAESVFPQLAVNKEYPKSKDVWEISRFGVHAPRHQSSAVLLNFALMFLFGRQVSAKSFVAVSDLMYERYLRKAGIRTRRYGPPEVVGKTRRGRDIKAVSGEIPLDTDTNPNIQHFLKLARGIKIHDETILGRHHRISA